MCIKSKNSFQWSLLCWQRYLRLCILLKGFKGTTARIIIHMSKLGTLFFCWQRDIHNKCNTVLEFFTFSNLSFDIEHNAWDSGRIERCTIWDPHLISCQRLSCGSLLLLLIHCIFTFCHWQNCMLDKYDNKLLNWPRPAYFERQRYIRSPLFHNIWQNPINIQAKQWGLF